MTGFSMSGARRLREVMLARNNGQTTVEYAVVLVLLLTIVVAAFGALQPAITAVFGTAADRLTALL